MIRIWGLKIELQLSHLSLMICLLVLHSALDVWTVELILSSSFRCEWECLDRVPHTFAWWAIDNLWSKPGIHQHLQFNSKIISRSGEFKKLKPLEGSYIHLYLKGNCELQTSISWKPGNWIGYTPIRSKFSILNPKISFLCFNLIPWNCYTKILAGICCTVQKDTWRHRLPMHLRQPTFSYSQ